MRRRAAHGAEPGDGRASGRPRHAADGAAGTAAGIAGGAAGTAGLRAGVHRLQGRSHDLCAVPPLRGPARSLGRRGPHRLDGPRAHQRPPREPFPGACGTGRAHRRGARITHHLLRLDGPAGARRARQAPAHHAGGPDGVPAPVAGGAAGGRGLDGGGAAQLSGRGAGGGPHDGRSSREAEGVRGVGGSRSCGWRCRSAVRGAVRAVCCRD